MQMTYNIDRHDAVRAAVLHLGGDIDIAMVPELRSAFDSLVESGVINVVIDLEQVTYADSSALGLLVWLDARLREREGSIFLTGANKDVSRILEISGLVSVARTVRSVENVATALESLEAFRRDALLLWKREVQMAADVELLAGVRGDIVAMIEPLGFSEASLFDVRVALGEALANAIRHGSHDDGNSVEVRLEAYDDRVLIAVEDSGCGFDGDHAGSDDLYASGGRGIMFMRALMDHVDFSRGAKGGTVVTLVKHRHTDTADGG